MTFGWVAAVWLVLGMARLAAGAEADIFSSVVSYQFLDSLATPDTPTTISSPVVSYQYFDWIGDENVTFQNSPEVSYFFRDNSALTIAGPASVPTGGNASYRALLGSQDVTVGASFSFAQPTPSYAGIGGSTLFVSGNAPTGTLLLRAAYGDPAGQFVGAGGDQHRAEFHSNGVGCGAAFGREYVSQPSHSPLLTRGWSWWNQGV